MRRLAHLEGLRGLACLQVVLNHTTQAFWPRFADLNPLCRFVSDGGVAVCLFFLLSGTVLTYAYEQDPAGIVRNLIRRVIRLGVPLFAACLAALVLRTLARNGLHAAAANSAWLASHAMPLSIAGAVRDATVWTVAGYADTTLFGALSPFLPGVITSVDGPIWSLHVELWGSAMMLALVASKLGGMRTRRLAVLACAAICGLTPMLLFVAGHIAAPLARNSRSRPIVGCLLLTAGVASAAFHLAPGVYAVARIANVFAVLHPQAFFSLTSLPAAAFIFVGVLYLPVAQRVLSTGVLRFLGRLSFAIYLLHEPLILSVGVAAANVAGAGAGIAVTLIATLLLAAVFERCVDRPAILLSRAVWRRTTAAMPRPSAPPGYAR